MIDSHDEERLQAHLDGESSPSESADVQRRRAGSSELDARARELEQLASFLSTHPMPEPPALLREAVMQRIPARVAPRYAAVTRRFGGHTMTRKVMFGLTAAAVIILAVISFTGFPPEPDGILGSISGARRSVKPQIAATDVQVGDTSAQAFLQSEVFDRLLKNPDAVRLLSDASLRKELTDADLRLFLASDAFKALSAADIRRWFSDGQLTEALASEELHTALADQHVSEALAEAEVTAALATSEVRVLFMDAGFVEALAKADFRAELFSEGALRGELASQYARWLSETSYAALNKAIARSEFRDALRDTQFQEALASTALHRMLGEANVREALRSQDFASALSSMELRRALRNDSFASALREPSFATAMADMQLSSALRSEVMATALKANGFTEALREPGFADAMARATLR